MRFAANGSGMTSGARRLLACSASLVALATVSTPAWAEADSATPATAVIAAQQAAEKVSERGCTNCPAALRMRLKDRWFCSA